MMNHDLKMLLAQRNIIFSISRSCFTMCLGCYNHFSPIEELIESDHNLSFLRFIKNNNISDKVTFGGGDPLTRPDILDLLRNAKKMGFAVNLDTVGTAFLEDSRTIFYGDHFIEKLDIGAFKESVDLLGIPIDGADNETANFFRQGRESIIEEQIKILRMCENHKINVCVNTVLHKQNSICLIDIFNLIGHLSCVIKWQIFQFMPIGPLGYKNRDLYSISTEDFKAKTGNLIEYVKFTNINIEPKSVSDRVEKYILIDSAGSLWTPTSNSSKRIFGNIKDIYKSA